MFRIFLRGMNRILLLLLLTSMGAVVCRAQVASQPYPLQLDCSGKDSVLLLEQVKMPLSFPSKEACAGYIGQLPATFRKMGFLTASIDSVRIDSTAAYLKVFVGEAWKWGDLDPGNVPRAILEAAGWRGANQQKVYDPGAMSALQQKIVDWMNNNGYPFAAVTLDSLQLNSGVVSARLQLDSGRRYTIDSIRVFGEGKINNRFLQKYLELPNGVLYRSAKLEQVSKRMRELPFLEETQPWQLSMLSTGAVLDMYLAPKKSSQVDVLIGFLPGSDQPGGKRFLVTGEANIQLKNALQQGESIGLNWQQLQVQSPRLHLNYAHPYIANSNLGIDFSFELFKKDSSFLNLQASAGLQYLASAEKTGKIFIQTFRTNLLTVDTNTVFLTRQLPEQIDMSVLTLGVSYSSNKTDYRNNPRKGFAWETMVTAGQKKIRENNGIIGIKDPNFDFSSLYDSLQLNSYQFIARTSLNKYFPLGIQSTFKAAFNGAWLESPDIFRNELFQIGGYRLLRGFDEQSIFVSRYGVFTGEYRYLVGRDSYFAAFTDMALTQNRSRSATMAGAGTVAYIGAGLGMAFETKAGIFNLSWAAGKRGDLPFDVRQSKIHFGYVNYF